MPNKELSPLYLIALVPDPEVREAVRGMKLEMQERFGASHALKSPAHITLQMPFRRPEYLEDPLLESLRQFCAKETPFRVQLSGFDCFAPRVLFVRVADHRPLIGLESRLRAALAGEAGIPKTKDPRPFHPHMTIATRDLPESAFPKAWDVFKYREFRASFAADRLFLLKHNGKTWDLFREIPFRGHSGQGFGVGDNGSLKNSSYL